MSPESAPNEVPLRRRPAVLAGAGGLLALLVAAGVGAALLPTRAFDLLAAGLEGSRPRAEAAFAGDVPAALRDEFLVELEEQVAWLRRRRPADLDPEAALAAAALSERLSQLLADGRLEPAECRLFTELSLRLRAPDSVPSRLVPVPG